MPHIDRRSGEIVVRIVYDGAPEAGKTTNIQHLLGCIPLQRRGVHASPESKSRRTEYFDWLDFAGGFVDGRRVRCQLVTVPGQPQLLHRRKYLLETADSVVFVADSTAERIDTSRKDLLTLQRWLDRLGGELAIGLVLQANKQDLDRAFAPRELAQELGLAAEVPAVPAVATAGRGVLDTFVLAARLATDRARALVLRRELAALDDRDLSPASLHAAIVAMEGPASRPPSVAEAGAEAMTAPPSPAELLNTRPNGVERARACRIPRADTLLAGHVWPSVRGRTLVSGATGAGAPTVPGRVLDWAPVEPIELSYEGGWVLHSSDRWCFASEADARLALIAKVRGWAQRPELVPEGRAIFVAPDEAGYRLWILTHAEPSLADEVTRAVASCDAASLSAALSRCGRATAALREHFPGAAVSGGAASVALREERVLVLATEQAADAAADGGAIPPDAHARLLAERAAGGDAERRRCLAEVLDSERARVRMMRIPTEAVASIHESKVRHLAEQAHLSDRERDVLKYLLMGRTLGEIATILDISPSTVKFHQANVLEKLGAESRGDLLRLIF